MRLVTLYAATAIWVAVVTAKEGVQGAKAGYRHTEYHKKGKKCYQCAWSPPKLAYATLKRSLHQSPAPTYHESDHSGIFYSTKKVPVKVQGGWDKCYDSFSQKQAEEFGIDQWECEHNCYIRTDKNGNLYRGCYKGEYNVNPKKLGCHMQSGSLYCFCSGELCNNDRAPDAKKVSLSAAYSGKRSFDNDFHTFDYNYNHGKYHDKFGSYERKTKYKYEENSPHSKYDVFDKYGKYGKYDQIDEHDNGYKPFKYIKRKNKMKRYKNRNNINLSSESYEDVSSDDLDLEHRYNEIKKHKRSTNRVRRRYPRDHYGRDKPDYDEYEYSAPGLHKYRYDKHELQKDDNLRHGDYNDHEDDHSLHNKDGGKSRYGKDRRRRYQYRTRSQHVSKYGRREHDQHAYDTHAQRKRVHGHNNPRYTAHSQHARPERPKHATTTYPIQRKDRQNRYRGRRTGYRYRGDKYRY